MSEIQESEMQCPECGALISGGLEGCRALLNNLAHRFPAAGPGMRLRRLVVDAFCLQHPASYCHSAKSMAAHLGGLCCGLEFGGHPKVYRALQQWLNGPKHLQRPDPPPRATGITIHHVVAAPLSQNLAQTIEAWSQIVWSSWSPHHGLARQWLKAALGEPA
jgi:hypothetical protein